MDFQTAHQIVLGSAFGIALVMGAVANKTNFCTMGAISDLVNIGDSGRMRAWLLAIAVAVLGVAILEWYALINVDANVTRPQYRTANFMWPRYLIGGLLFGIGMTFASGCGNKTLVRIGGGNIKSILVLITMGIMAWAMNRTNFSANVFLPWMDPLAIDLGRLQARSQDLGAILMPLLGMNDAPDAASLYRLLKLGLGAGLSVLLIVLVFRSKSFRGSFDNILGGVVIGAAVVAAWYVTAGTVGETWMEEWLMLDVQPEAVRAQSLTFVDPAGQAIYYAMKGGKYRLITFGLIAGLGVLVGSFLWSIITRKFRIEWFASFRDFLNHAIGGALMGVGGILSFGCTIGQGVTGISTLALGSFLTFGAIVLGSALTMKIQLYKMVYEQAGILDVMLTSLVDLHLLPKGLRKLEAV